MKAVTVATALCLSVMLALTGARARASGPPVVSVGPLTAPNGAATGSASADSGGEAAACLNNEHSGVNPAGSGTGAVQLRDRACTTATEANGSGPAAAPRESEKHTSVKTSSVGSAGAAGSARSGAVTAANARGLRIASIRVDKRRFAKARRLRVLVTIRDKRKRIVRDAVVSLGCPRGGQGVAGCAQSTFTNRFGRATFQLRLGPRAAGRLMSLAVTARTPSVHVRKLVIVRLSKPSRRSGRR